MKPPTTFSLKGGLKQIARLVEKLAQKPIQPLSINDLLSFQSVRSCGPMLSHEEMHHQNRPEMRKNVTKQQIIASSSFLQHELPVRLAHRIYDFFRLPYVVVSNDDVRKVYEMHLKAFQVLYDCGKITTLEDEKKFAAVLEQLLDDHLAVVPLMQEGILELRASYPDISLDGFLDRLFYTRIGNRLGAAHHLAFHEDFESQTKKVHAAFGGGVNSNSSSPLSSEGESLGSGAPKSTMSDYIGIVHQRCRPKRMAESVAESVRDVARRTYGVAPVIKVIGDDSLTFPYIPEHIRFVLFEMIKNSVRATIENQQMKSIIVETDEELPEVSVEVCRGYQDVIIKVSDQGGGVSNELMPHIWMWGFTTAHQGAYDCSYASSTDQFVSAYRTQTKKKPPIKLFNQLSQVGGGSSHKQSEERDGISSYGSMRVEGDRERRGGEEELEGSLSLDSDGRAEGVGSGNCGDNGSSSSSSGWSGSNSFSSQPNIYNSDSRSVNPSTDESQSLNNGFNHPSSPADRSANNPYSHTTTIPLPLYTTTPVTTTTASRRSTSNCNGGSSSSIAFDKTSWNSDGDSGSSTSSSPSPSLSSPPSSSLSSSVPTGRAGIIFPSLVNPSSIPLTVGGRFGGGGGRRELAGYGFGLPLSRLYSRYFGGNLEMKSMDGFGSDTYITLPLLGTQTESPELLNNCRGGEGRFVNGIGRRPAGGEGQPNSSSAFSQAK